MAVKLKIDYRDKATEELRKMQLRTRDSAPAWDRIGALMLRSVEKNFQSGGRPTPWAPLSVTTLAMMANRVTRRKKGQTLAQARFQRLTAKKILIDTAILKNSITYQVLGASGVEVGTNVPYGKIHQLGGMAGRGRKVKIPARPFLLVQAEDVPRITQILGNWIVVGKAVPSNE